MSEQTPTRNDVHETPSAPETAPRSPGFFDRLGDAMSNLADRIRTMIRDGNRRRLEVRRADGRELFGLPLTLAVILGFLLIWRLALPFLLLVVVALALRWQFVVVRRDAPSAE